MVIQQNTKDLIDDSKKKLSTQRKIKAFRNKENVEVWKSHKDTFYLCSQV